MGLPKLLKVSIWNVAANKWQAAANSASGVQLLQNWGQLYYRKNGQVFRVTGIDVTSVMPIPAGELVAQVNGGEDAST